MDADAGRAGEEANMITLRPRSTKAIRLGEKVERVTCETVRSGHMGCQKKGCKE